MIALALSILVSTLLFSCFRLFPKFNVRLEEAVVLNYIVAGSVAIRSPCIPGLAVSHRRVLCAFLRLRCLASGRLSPRPRMNMSLLAPAPGVR